MASSLEDLERLVFVPSAGWVRLGDMTVEQHAERIWWLHRMERRVEEADEADRLEAPAYVWVDDERRFVPLEEATDEQILDDYMREMHPSDRALAYENCLALCPELFNRLIGN